MTRTCFLITCLLAWPALSCADAPAADAADGASRAAPALDCSQLGAQIAGTEEARRTALAQADGAWKAVVPFVILARKISGNAAAGEADKKLADLRRQAQQQGCNDHVG